MMKKIIICELKKMGYAVEETVTVKNGIEYDGFIMGYSEVAPVFYTDWLMDMAKKNMSIATIVKEVVNTYEEHKNPNLDVKEIFTRGFLKENLNIALQKKSAEQLIKKLTEFEGIEQYLYVRKEGRDGSYSFKIKKEILEKAQLSEEEAWQIASENLENETIIKSLAVLMGFTTEENEDDRLYIVSNTSKTKGASAILCKNKIVEFARKRKIEKFVVFPSSIHEMLLMPYEKGMNLDELSEMVRNINDKSVMPEERLTDMVYLMEF